MTNISFKPVDMIKETYEHSHYKDLNKARPAFKTKIEAFEIPNGKPSMNSKSWPFARNPKCLN